MDSGTVVIGSDRGDDGDSDKGTIRVISLHDRACLVDYNSRSVTKKKKKQLSSLRRLTPL